MIRLCGAALGLFAFALTIILGISAGNPGDVTITRAIAALFVFCLIGLGTGWVANQVLDEHALAKNREMFPEEPDQPAMSEAEERSGDPVAE